jgi:hypothetical protein
LAPCLFVIGAPVLATDVYVDASPQEFPLMYYKMTFVVVSATLDTHPWYQLLGLSATTLAILVWVLVDKPYRCPEGNHHGMTEGDWQMVIAQILQLLSYGVAAVCLIDSHSGRAASPADQPVR